MKNYLFIFLIFLISNTNAQVLFPPSNLTYELDENDVSLNWNEPDTTIPQTLTYSSEQNANAIGISGGGTFAVAAQWEPDQLIGLSNSTISSVGLFVLSENAEYTIKIWQGPNADSLVYAQDIDNPVANEFFEVELNVPVPINANSNLRVGYDITHDEGDYPVGLDQGPAVVGFGDLLYYDNQWQSLSDFGFNANWNIIVYLQDASGKKLAPGRSIAEQTNYKSSGKLKIIKQDITTFPVMNSKSVLLEGYNVYRNDTLLTQNAIEALDYVDSNLPDGIYQYDVTAVYGNQESLPASSTVYKGNYGLALDPQQIIDTVTSFSNQNYLIQVTNTASVAQTYYASATASWLYAYPTASQLQPGETVSIELWLFHQSFGEGTYQESIIFTDSENEQIAELPVSITLESAPSLAYYPHELNFGNVNFGKPAFQHLQLYNNGNDTLVIDSITTGNSFIEYSPQLPLSLAPYEFHNDTVYFNSNELGEFNGTIDIFSNDFDNPEINVPVSANVVLESPEYVLSHIDSMGVNLNWTMGIDFTDPWFGWSDEKNYTAMGSGTNDVFHAAARWFPEDLDTLAGQTITKVAFFPYGHQSEYTLKIWQGDSTAQPWLSQEIKDYKRYTWNVVNLENPVTISNNEQLWIVFEIDNAHGEYPMGLDGGPAAENRGNLINTGDGWTALENYYNDFNWNIQALVSSQVAGLKAPLANVEPLKQPDQKVKISEIPEKPLTIKMRSSLEPLGYNVYKDSAQINDALITETSFTEQNPDPGIYEYGVSAVYDLGESMPTRTTVQTAAPEINFNPELLTAEVDGDSVVVPFTISNSGTIDLEFSTSYYNYYYTLSQDSGTIEPGDDLQMDLTIDATYLYPGTTETYISFHINNINEPIVYLPLTIEVAGNGLVTSLTDSLNFGMVEPGDFSIRYVELTNEGPGYGFVENLETTTDAFEVYASQFYLQPGQTYDVAVYFFPQNSGVFSDSLTISTSDQEFVIPLSGEGAYTPPMGLTAQADSTDVYLDWISPTGIPDNTLQYSANELFSAIGYGDGNLNVAARFTQEELMSYNDKSLTAIGFKPAESGADITIKIWEGSDAQNLIFEQEIDDYTVNEWNDISLNIQLPISDFETIWVGYEIANSEYIYAAGIDQGPAVAGKGDMVSLDGGSWESMSAIYGLSYNFLIRTMVSADSTMPATVIGWNQDPQLNETYKSTNLLGYNVYRDGEKLNGNSPVMLTEYLDESLADGTYNYEVTALYEDGESPAIGPATVTINANQTPPPGWNYQVTGMTHSIFIPFAGTKSGDIMQPEPGDYIGVFYPNGDEEQCAGFVRYNGQDTLRLLANGDDPATPEKEGFHSDEHMHWRIYSISTGQKHTLDVTYNPAMPQHDGNFTMLGMSMISGMTMAPVSNTSMTTPIVRVYPQPVKDFVNVSGLDSYDRIMVIDETGKTVAAFNIANKPTVQIDWNYGNGFYILRLMGQQKTLNKPLIVE